MIRCLNLSQVVLLVAFLAGCTTAQVSKDSKRNDLPQAARREVHPPVSLLDQLRMRRQPHDLGFAEKQFSACDPSIGSTCKSQFFSVVHFQLLCRDSEGTVSNVPIHLTPLTSGQVQWQVGGLNGSTQTDQMGFGQFNVVSDRSLYNQRLIIRIGKQFMGFSVSEVSKVVLPQNFCI